jgi:hypothetical protein
MNDKGYNKPESTSIIGYGTFITQGLWKSKSNVEVCLINHFSRILPPNSWFPYILPSTKSFWALKFDVLIEELTELDYYEGVPESIFQREKVQVSLKTGEIVSAFLYIPTRKTISKENLSLELDTHDRWKLEIKKHITLILKLILRKLYYS